VEETESEPTLSLRGSETSAPDNLLLLSASMASSYSARVTARPKKSTCGRGGQIIMYHYQKRSSGPVGTYICTHMSGGYRSCFHFSNSSLGVIITRIRITMVDKHIHTCICTYILSNTTLTGGQLPPSMVSEPAAVAAAERLHHLGRLGQLGLIMARRARAARCEMRHCNGPTGCRWNAEARKGGVPRSYEVNRGGEFDW
jgi:hypothetical protein